MDPKDFFELFPEKMFYVGFLQFEQGWVPLCTVSDPEKAKKLDTLLVSHSYAAMDDLLKRYAEKIPETLKTFVHYLNREEMENLIDRYGITSITPDSDEQGGCGCGCNCG
jgi:hypothetical protein